MFEISYWLAPAEGRHVRESIQLASFLSVCPRHISTLSPMLLEYQNDSSASRQNDLKRSTKNSAAAIAGRPPTSYIALSRAPVCLQVHWFANSRDSRCHAAMRQQ
jgi:hypothetical protein